MKLKDYIKALNNLKKKHPECLDFELVSSSDDEGNSFGKVYYGPSLGHFQVEFGNTGEFTSLKEIVDNGEEAKYPLNSVCIN